MSHTLTEASEEAAAMVVPLGWKDTWLAWLKGGNEMLLGVKTKKRFEMIHI